MNHVRKQVRSSLLPASCWFLAYRPLRWRRHVLPKRRLTFNGLLGVILQKTEFVITIAVRTWNPIMENCYSYWSNTVHLMISHWKRKWVLLLWHYSPVSSQHIGLPAYRVRPRQGLYNPHGNTENTHVHAPSGTLALEPSVWALCTSDRARIVTSSQRSIALTATAYYLHISFLSNRDAASGLQDDVTNMMFCQTHLQAVQLRFINEALRPQS
jgi:hypothetical protein